MRMRPATGLPALLGLLLGACEGTVGDVLSEADPGAPLGEAPAGCLDGVLDGTACWFEAAWTVAAERTCADRGLALAALSPLDGCAAGFSRSTYFRCCPPEARQLATNALAQPGMLRKE